MCVCVQVNGCVQVSVGAMGQRKASDRLELELQELVSCSMWVLGTEPRSSVRTVSVTNH